MSADTALSFEKTTGAKEKNSSLLAETSQAKQSLVGTQAHLQHALAVERKLRKEKDALWKRRDRVPEQQSKAVSKAVQKATTHQLQEKGAVLEASREMVCELVQLNVPVANISSVVKVVNDSAGVTTNGLISQRTVSQIVLEGGVASKVQLVEEIWAVDSQCEFSYDYSNALCCLSGIALSGDGTTHKSVNYESKYVTLQVPDYVACSSGGAPDAMTAIPADHFFGISSALNHTSETQLAGWQEVVQEFYELFNDMPLDSCQWAILLEFAIKIKGMHTDHAEDQKKLACLIQS